MAPSAVARVGVDLVDTELFRGRFEGRDDVLREVFCEEELAYCQGQRRPWPHLAARLAAKEAAFKALGSGLAGAMTWRDVEVTRDAAGAPGLAFHGATAAALAREGLHESRVSLSHTGTHAIAFVVLFHA
jgi:holo-[acyl-carrier protein] synthase